MELLSKFALPMGSRDDIYNFEMRDVLNTFDLKLYRLIEVKMRIFNDDVQEDSLSRYERCERV